MRGVLKRSSAPEGAEESSWPLASGTYGRICSSCPPAAAHRSRNARAGAGTAKHIQIGGSMAYTRIHGKRALPLTHRHTRMHTCSPMLDVIALESFTRALTCVIQRISSRISACALTRPHLRHRVLQARGIAQHHGRHELHFAVVADGAVSSGCGGYEGK
jgi:hypothetical protein